MWFYVSLCAIAPVGLAFLVWWAVFIYRRFGTRVGRPPVLQIIAFKTLVLMIPGILTFFLFCAPVVYLNYLFKQDDYCREYIRFNKITTIDADLEQRCKSLDLGELLGESKNN